MYGRCILIAANNHPVAVSVQPYQARQSEE